ncbi:hypothetical protein ElyMa_000192300 [Elysia marginata]|uniref:GON domain-containing protein n=1 Tax=Elysia marginata TaxID=1093978 RepID=A0AAV4EWY2_9GAST|nr:hypothetical protein ElyMa_000192300 [Elysia marginata]
MKAECGPKCRMHCQQTIKKEQRETMFHMFWRTGSIDMRRIYVCHTDQVKDSLNYNMEVEGAKIPVCKTFSWTPSGSVTSLFSQQFLRKMREVIVRQICGEDTPNTLQE